MDIEGDDTATVLSLPISDHQSKSAFKAEVAETRSSLQSLKTWITQGRDATDLANFQASLQLKTGQRSLEASWGTSSTGFPGQESPDGDDLLMQTTEALEIQLLSREVEAERLRAELMRRVDGQEGSEQALQPEPVGQGAEVELEPLWQELQSVKEKVSMLAKQLSHERDATLKLEEKTRRLRGLSTSSDSSQALHQRELHELRNAARSLGEVMHEYRQQWAKLTAQVDILEQHSLACMPDLPPEDGCGSKSQLPWLGVASPAISPVSSSRPDTPARDPRDLRELGERNGSAHSSPPRSPKRGSSTPQRSQVANVQARGSWGSASAAAPTASPSLEARRQRSPPSSARSTIGTSSRLAGAPTSPSRSGSSPPRRRWRPRSASPSSAPVDEVDEMWCKVLQCFPEHPEWVILKERPGVYRLGHPGGRAVMAKVSYAGLQVRVGGGWMPAEAFLRRYGDAWLSNNSPVSDSLSSSTGRQPQSPRLLSPTKSWANRVGLQTAPDFRQLRSAYYSDQQQPRNYMSPPEEVSPRSAAAIAAAEKQAYRLLESSLTGSQFSSIDILPGIMEIAEPPAVVPMQSTHPAANGSQLSAEQEVGRASLQSNGQGAAYEQTLGRGRPAVQKFMAGQQPNGTNPPEADVKFVSIQEPLRGSKPTEADVRAVASVQQPMSSPPQPKRASPSELDATWASTSSLPTFGTQWSTVPSTTSSLVAPAAPPMSTRATSPGATPKPSVASRPASAAAPVGIASAKPSLALRIPNLPAASPRPGPRATVSSPMTPAAAAAMQAAAAIPAGAVPAAMPQPARATATRTVRFAPTPGVSVSWIQQPVRASLQIQIHGNPS
mmetsp:Transcript_153821/g.266214  ORF Transcript_153821/g.266214 Transcript_153821/m.266214 type:complete len:839 (-) Transcript_153821:61-2577(-)